MAIDTGYAKTGAETRTMNPGEIGRYSLFTLLRIEDQNAQIVGLLTEIRDRLGAPATPTEAENAPAPDIAGAVEAGMAKALAPLIKALKPTAPKGSKPPEAEPSAG